MPILPTFVIEYCINCKTHQWCTRHDENKYEMIASQVQAAIQAAIPTLSQNQILKGEFNYQLIYQQQVQISQDKFRTYQPTEHMQNIFFRNKPSGPVDQIQKMQKMQVGALEVYFMGVRIFSKIQSGLWPLIPSLAERCLNVYNQYINDEDINQFETQIFQKPLISQEINSQRPKTSHITANLQQQLNLQHDQIIQKGRKISLGECKFIFDKIWKTSREGCNEDAQETHHGDHIHPKEKEQNIVMLDDLFQIVHLASLILNKKEPSGNDTKPFEQFLKFSQQQIVTDKEGQDPHFIQFVETKDFHKVLFGIFVGQEDEKKTQIAEIINKFSDDDPPKQLIEHIVDQVWIQFDQDKSGMLEKEEQVNFIGTVLEMKEKIIAKEQNRPPKEITEEEVYNLIKECDLDHDGKITKQEMNLWLKNYMQTKKKDEHEFVLELIKQKSSQL